ncbi:endonuclease domain-containing protein [Dokdonia sp. LLG6352-1]|uniref:endonuclease domain-containing protein n=1 Tax=Dokdonia sp. LLG6352-1 TaxID=3160831 RepID=UPI00386D9A6A
MQRLIPYRRDLKVRAQELRKNMTLAELALWDKIRRKSLGVEFHRQVPLLDYIVDFYCHEIGLAIEIDGNIHDNQVMQDGIRQGRLEEKGVHFLRFKNEEVFEEIDVVLTAIEDKIQESL